MISSVCVFCGSSFGTNPTHAEQALAFGRVLAENKIRLVYGGGNTGLMGKVARGALDNGGKVTGIIPEFLTSKERIGDSLDELDEVVITQDMVGQTIGQFMAVEVKRDDFVGRESDDRYVAQRNFIECVKSLGGFAMFAKKEKDVFP